jgi:hypothetical protein
MPPHQNFVKEARREKKCEKTQIQMAGRSKE